MWLLTGVLAYESILRLIPGHSGHHSHINSNAMILTAALAFSANIMWVCNSKRQMFLRVYCSSSLGVVCCVCKKNLSRDWSLFIGGGGGSQEFGFPTVKFKWFPRKVLKYSCVLPSLAINSLWSSLYTLLATTGPPHPPPLLKTMWSVIIPPKIRAVLEFASGLASKHSFQYFVVWKCCVPLRFYESITVYSLAELFSCWMVIPILEAITITRRTWQWKPPFFTRLETFVIVSLCWLAQSSSKLM